MNFKDSEYLFLVHGREARELSPQELGTHLAAWNQWIDELREAGRLQGAAPLTDKGAEVRKGQVVDGPYAETKDAVSGYLIVWARDLRFAAELAKTCPVFEVGGWVEVRQISPALQDGLPSG